MAAIFKLNFAGDSYKMTSFEILFLQYFNL